MSDLRLMPGVKCSPTVMLHMALEDMSKTRGVVLLTMGTDDCVEVYTSCMSIADLAFATMKLQIHLTEIMKGETPEGTTVYPGNSA